MTNNLESKDLILQVGVKILISNAKGEYLLLRRSLEKYPDVKGRWDIVGGRIETGKTLIENLKREVMEETGLELSGEPNLVAAQDILRKPGYHVVRLTYIGEAKGEIKLDIDENDMYKWYSQGELEKLDDTDIFFKELIEKGIFNINHKQYERNN